MTTDPTPIPARPGGLELIRRPDDGVDMYGLYVEFVQHAGGSPAGAPIYYYRVFVAGGTISTYKREMDKKSTIWRMGRGADHNAAAEHLKKLLKRPGVMMRGEPVLVQLRATDILSMDKSDPPASRYEGLKYLERKLGKFDPLTWRTLVKDEIERAAKVAVDKAVDEVAAAAAPPAPAPTPAPAAGSAMPAASDGATPPFAPAAKPANVNLAALEALVHAAEAAKEEKR